jgi:hypothetical protein
LKTLLDEETDQQVKIFTAAQRAVSAFALFV